MTEWHSRSKVLILAVALGGSLAMPVGVRTFWAPLVEAELTDTADG